MENRSWTIVCVVFKGVLVRRRLEFEPLERAPEANLLQCHGVSRRSRIQSRRFRISVAHGSGMLSSWYLVFEEGAQSFYPGPRHVYARGDQSDRTTSRLHRGVLRHRRARDHHRRRAGQQAFGCRFIAAEKRRGSHARGRLRSCGA